MKQLCYKCKHNHMGEVETIDGKEYTMFDCDKAPTGTLIKEDFDAYCEDFALDSNEVILLDEVTLSYNQVNESVDLAIENVFTLTRLTMKIGAKAVAKELAKIVAKYEEEK